MDNKKPLAYNSTRGSSLLDLRIHLLRFLNKAVKVLIRVPAQLSNRYSAIRSIKLKVGFFCASIPKLSDRRPQPVEKDLIFLNAEGLESVKHSHHLLSKIFSFYTSIIPKWSHLTIVQDLYLLHLQQPVLIISKIISSIKFFFHAQPKDTFFYGIKSRGELLRAKLTYVFCQVWLNTINKKGAFIWT